MSTRKIAPTSSAIERKASKSMIRAYALPPAMMSLGCSLPRLIAHDVVVDPAGGGVDAVVYRLPDHATVIHRGAVRQVAAVRQRHAHQLSAGRQHGHERGEVGLRTRVRLHVGVIGAEELLEAIDGELLDLVDDLAPAVVPPAGVPLGVLVGERRAHGIDDRPAREVLAGDQLQTVLLPAQLLVDRAAPRSDRLGGAMRCDRDSSLLLVDFGDPAAVPPSFEFCLQPRLQDVHAFAPRSRTARGGRARWRRCANARAAPHPMTRRPPPARRGAGWRRRPFPDLCRRAAHHALLPAARPGRATSCAKSG